MKSVCVTKAYYIIADGYTECYTFNSREEAESFIELFKPFYKNKTVMIQEANVFTSYIKIYCIVINGKIQEKLDFDSMEIAKDYIKLFSLKYRQENTIAIREIYRITTDIIIREVYQNVD
jgi:hypothetical protein